MSSSDFELPPTVTATPRTRAQKKAEDIAAAEMATAAATKETLVDGETEATPSEKSEFSQDELNIIFDQILFEGSYIEEVVIRGKLKVRLRSRTTGDTMDIANELDSTGYQMVQTLEQYRGVRNLAYSLVRYGDKDLSSAKMEERFEFIKKLPAFVTSALISALYKFDRKVAAACTEAEENF